MSDTKKVGMSFGLLALASLLWFNRDGLAFSAALLLAEHRPALIADAAWDDPASARDFAARFAPGTSQDDLLSWLQGNRFSIDRAAGVARRVVGSFPCNEEASVRWRADQTGKLLGAEAVVREAGCL